MGRRQRFELIKKLEEQTNSRILVYMTGDRKGLETRISVDVIPFIHKYLEKIGNVPKINLLIYTTGGITIAGYGIVNVIREYCKEFGIMIPFKCLSTGTLMALGADSIIMSKMGQLGPIDPSMSHPLAPLLQNPQNTAVRGNVPVNVEDVVSFLDLAKKEAGTNSEEELTKVLLKLSDVIHPLVLGAVNRSRNQIRFLAKALLKKHTKDENKIDTIVKTLVEERFSHDYLIGRQEAVNDLNLDIIDVSDDVMTNMMKLYDEYRMLLELDAPPDNESILGNKSETKVTFHRSVIECKDLTFTYSTNMKINRVRLKDPRTGILVTKYPTTLLKQEWVQNDAI